MMKKIATIATLAMLAPSALGACGANWITTDAGVDSTGDGANAGAAYATATDFATCAAIIGGETSCCAKTEVATFQTKATALVEELKTAVSTRDQYILDRRGDVLAVRDSLNTIQESLGSLSGDNAAIAAALSTFTSAYTTTIDSFTEDFTALKAGFVTLQTNRVDCFNALVKAQVSIWCAACNDDLAVNKGITVTDATSGTVAFGTAFTTYLAEECSAYVASAAEQSGILSLYAVSDYLAALASALSKLADGDAEGALTDITEFMTDFGTIVVPTNELHRVGYAPATCTTASCAWASDLLTTGILDNELATVGGQLTAPSRRLQEAPAGRMLTLDVNPNTDAVGITVDFPENPGNVDNDQNSAVRNGAIACAITALAAML